MGTQIDANEGIWTTDLQLPDQKHCALGYQALLFAMLQSILFQQQASLRSESNRDHSKMKNESVKKSLEKSRDFVQIMKSKQRKQSQMTAREKQFALNLNLINITN